MKKPSPFHAEFRRLAPVLPRGGGGLWRMRSMRLIERFQHPDRPRAGIDVERVGPVTVRVHRSVSAGARRPALLWIHGGGYVFGTVLLDEAFCRRVARELDVIVAAVSYRRAPEYPFPIPLHDCHDALTWLASRPDVDNSRIAVGGASAGGGLAAALALLARERAEVDLVYQLLSYPMLDDRTAARTDIDQHNLRFWNNDANRFGWHSYLGVEPGSPEVSDLAAPARHGDLAGLPSAWIGVGTLDLFYEEDVRYAERLRAAGTCCELHVVDGVFHGFDGFRAVADVSRRYKDAQVTALASALIP